MNVRSAARFLLVSSVLLSGCGFNPLSTATSTPTSTSIPTATQIPAPTALPHGSYVELARQSGFVQFQDDETIEGITFSFWLPEPYVEEMYYYWDWEAGEFLAAVAERNDDYAYDIYAENKLFTGSDTTFYYGSSHANECSELTNKVDVYRVDLVVRTGQDQQLAGMTTANYAGLLANAIQNMRGDEGMYPQVSEPFEAPGFEAWRIISDFNLPCYDVGSCNVTFIDYILKDEDRLWVLTFSVDTQLFWEEEACTYLADDFDLVARTFEVIHGQK